MRLAENRRLPEGPSLALMLLFALLLAVCLSVGAYVDGEFDRATQRSNCRERFFPQGHLISEQVAHRTPIKYLSY
jgi:hypothetical protein